MLLKYVWSIIAFEVQSWYMVPYLHECVTVLRNVWKRRVWIHPVIIGFNLPGYHLAWKSYKNKRILRMIWHCISWKLEDWYSMHFPMLTVYLLFRLTLDITRALKECSSSTRQLIAPILARFVIWRVSMVTRSSPSPKKFNQLFLMSLRSYPENFIKIHS